MKFFQVVIHVKRKLAPELIAPCGMNCRICIAHFGYTLQGKKRKNARNGCRTRKSKSAFIQKQCEKLAKNQIAFCFECADCPCKNLKKLDKRYRENYGMSMIENLIYIQTWGMDKFLESEQEK
jgi:hypothetical protein